MSIWLFGTGGSVVLIGMLGGLLVFSRATTWDVVVTWSALFGGLAFTLGYFLTLDFMGQLDAGSTLCPGAQECDTAYGLGAMLVGAVVTLVVGLSFSAAYALKRARKPGTLPRRR